MTDHVDALLKEWRRSSFIWGTSDCLLSVGDYIASRGGADVSSSYKARGYSTEAEALALMQEAGGPASLIDATGVLRTDQPQRGDVVLIDLLAGVAGVHTGHSVAVRRERGLADIGLRFVTILAAWRVP